MTPLADVPPRHGAPVLPQLLLCSLLWASALPLMKVIGADVPPLALAALRGLMGAFFVGLWFLARRQSLLPQGREWRDWLMLGLLQGGIPNALTAYALTRIGAGLTAMIQASSPLLVALLAHFIFDDERLDARRGLGVAVGFVGIALLLGPAALGQDGDLDGVLAMLMTAVSYAFGNLYVRSIPHAEPARLAFGQQLFSGLPTLVLALVLIGPGAFAGAARHPVALSAFGVFGTALPIVFYMHILRVAGPTRGAMNAYLVPFWTVLLGIGFLKESVGLREIAVGVIVLTGVALAARRKGRAA
jgi:drug/metabolite transporter (DMT)-like permease